MTLQGVPRASRAPRFPHRLSHPPAPDPRDSAGLSLGRGEAQAVCKQASSASLRDVRAGPRVRGCARPGPAANPKGARDPASPALHRRGRPGAQAGARASRRRGAYSSPTRLQPPGGRGEEGLRPPSPGGGGGRSGRTPRPPGPRSRRQGPPRAAKGQRARDRATPRHTHLEQRPPPPQHGRGGRP